MAKEASLFQFKYIVPARQGQVLRFAVRTLSPYDLGERQTNTVAAHILKNAVRQESIRRRGGEAASQ